MRFLLDTNVCIKFLKGTSSNLFKNITALNTSDIAICSVVKYELYYGAYKSNRQNETLLKLNDFLSNFQSLHFDNKAADICGKIRAELELTGNIIGPYDLQIASIALSNNLILVTHNVREFSRINNLLLEDWE